MRDGDFVRLGGRTTAYDVKVGRALKNLHVFGEPRRSGTGLNAIVEPFGTLCVLVQEELDEFFYHFNHEIQTY